MLAKIINKLRNGYMVYHLGVSFKNVSFCSKVLDVLWKENLIRGYKKTNENLIMVFLRYHNGSPICRHLVVVSRPRDRIYLSRSDLHRASISSLGGVLILSTSKGIMTAVEAVREGKGGEILAYAS